MPSGAAATSSMSRSTRAPPRNWAPPTRRSSPCTSALDTLAKVDARLVHVVEMRYFAGLTDAEIGAALGVTDRTVRRDWERARLLLADLLGR